MATVRDDSTANPENNVAVQESSEELVGGPDSDNAVSQAGSSSTVVDKDDMTYYPNVRRSSRVSRPTERFDTLLVMQGLMGYADDPTSLGEAFSATDSAE